MCGADGEERHGEREDGGDRAGQAGSAVVHEGSFSETSVGRGGRSGGRTGGRTGRPDARRPGGLDAAEHGAPTRGDALATALAVATVWEPITRAITNSTRTRDISTAAAPKPRAIMFGSGDLTNSKIASGSEIIGRSSGRG